MRIVCRISLMWAIASLACFAGTVEIDGKAFTLPDEFTIEKVVEPPLADRPICADFDNRGNLYVADSSGSNENVNTQLEKRPHRIVRLKDTDGDGKFDQQTVYADKMMFPEGTLWHNGSLYVAAPPSIWKLTDTNDDGIADRREEWFQGKTLTGCANDLHGPYLGRDGWIYWCKGAFAEQTYDRQGQSPWVTRAAHIFRRRPEGGVIEPVMTGGMDNPVEVIFTPGGERIFTTTFLQHPSGGQRDGLIHAVYGGVYGKRHAVIEGHLRTGDLMPVLSHLGAAAPCGLLQIESQELGESYQGNLLTCCFNMQKLTRHQLKKSGATFSSETTDFLVCDDLDFHPTDVLEDADGSILVVDTGGWYKLCCPTSQLQKPDVLGAVYRIRRKGNWGTDRIPNTEWTKLDVHQLTAKLSSQHPVERKHAAAELANRGPDAIGPLSDLARNGTASNRLAATWALCRINAPAARASSRALLDDEDSIVRQAAIHTASLWKDAAATKQLISLLSNSDAHNQRAAAEALGRIGQGPEVVDALLSVIDKGNDRVLEHSLIYALIQIGESAPLRKALVANEPDLQVAAMIALDQVGDFSFDDVRQRLDASNPQIQAAAHWIAKQHNDWGSEIAESAWTGISATESESVRNLFRPLLLQSIQDEEIQKMISRLLVERNLPIDLRRYAITLVRGSKLQRLPSLWKSSFRTIFESTDDPLLSDSVLAVATFEPPKKDDPWAALLHKISRSQDLDQNTRLHALVSAPKQAILFDDATIALCVGLVKSDSESADTAIKALSTAQLSKDQLIDLIPLVIDLSPFQIRSFVSLFQQTTDEEIGRHLLAALRKAKSIESVPVPTLRDSLQHFGPTFQRDAEQFYSSLDLNRSEQLARLESLVQTLPQGDIRRGQRVFHGKVAACANCHEMGYLGGDVGPDLTRIGRIRTRRDLLESIVFPSASFVRSFEPHVIITNSGQVISGVLRDESNQEIRLITTDRKEIRIPTDEIDSRQLGKISIMPSGLDKQLTSQQLADLLAFMEAAK